MTLLSRLAILFAVEPFLGAIDRRKLEDNNSFRFPIPFEHFGLAAAHDVFAAVFLNRRARPFLVLFVTSRIGNLDFDNYVGRHDQSTFRFRSLSASERRAGDVSSATNYSRFSACCRAA